MNKQQAQGYIKRFFDEKEIPYQMFEFVDEYGNNHLIDNEAVIESIKDAHPGYQTPIANQLLKIDFHNGDVNHFLKYVAKGMIEMAGRKVVS